MFRIILKSGPIRLLAAFTIAAAILILIPPVARLLNNREIRYPTDAIRQPDFVLDGSFKNHEYPKRGKLTSQEPEWTEVYWLDKPALVSFFGPFINLEAPAPASETIIINPSEPIRSTYNREWRVVGFAVATLSDADSAELNVNDGPKKVASKLFNKELDPVPRIGFPQVLNGDEALLNPGSLPIEEGSIGTMRVFFETSLGDSFTANVVELRDAKTGWLISSQMFNKSGWSEGKGYVSYDLPLTSWYSGSAALWLTFHDGSFQRAVLEPKLGAEFSKVEDKIRIIETWTLQASGKWLMEDYTGRSKHEDIGPSGEGSFKSGFVLDVSDINYSELRLYDNEGREIRSAFTENQFVHDAIRVVTDIQMSEISKLEVLYNPGVYRVAIKFPFLPGLPEENRNLDDFREMKISVGDVSDLPFNFVEKAVQADTLVLNGRNPFIGEFNRKEFTLAEYMDHYSTGALNPESAYIEISDYESGRHVTTIRPKGTARVSNYPIQGRIVNFLLDWRMVILSLGVGLLLFLSWSLIKAIRLRQHLYSMGYIDWRFRSIWLSWLLLGKRAWRIPRVDELGVLPTVDVSRPFSVIRFFGSRR